MDIERYKKLYWDELTLRGKILYEKNQEKREEMLKQLDIVVAEMVEIETKMEAEWFASQANKTNEEDKVQ